MNSRTTFYKIGTLIWGITALLLTFGCISQRPPTVPTGEMIFPVFGDISKAEFYPIQMNPAFDGAEFVQSIDSGEVFYIVPSPILTGSDIETVEITGAGVLKAVTIKLGPSGKIKIDDFILANAPDNLVALIWKSKVYYTYSAEKLASGATVLLEDDLEGDFAIELADALK